LKKKTSQQAAEVGLSNPLRFFASRLAAALGRMKSILSHHLPKLPRLANPANSNLSREFSDVHRREFQGG